MTAITPDSGVFIYRFLGPERIKNAQRREKWKKKHEKAKIVYNDIILGKNIAIIPSAVLIEVASVISRMTANSSYGIAVAKEIDKFCIVIYEDQGYLWDILNLATEIRGSGFDNTIIATSILHKTTVITTDKRLYKNIKPREKKLKTWICLLEKW